MEKRWIKFIDKVEKYVENKKLFFFCTTIYSVPVGGA